MTQVADTLIDEQIEKIASDFNAQGVTGEDLAELAAALTAWPYVKQYLTKIKKQRKKNGTTSNSKR